MNQVTDELLHEVPKKRQEGQSDLFDRLGVTTDRLGSLERRSAGLRADAARLDGCMERRLELTRAG